MTEQQIISLLRNNCLYRGKQRLKTMLLQKGVERE